MRVPYGLRLIALERKRREPKQKDPMLLELIEALERRYTQEEISEKSGVPRSIYQRMRAGSQTMSYQAVDSWLALLNRRAQIGRRIKR